eukprot:18270-Eustigmatos_ZCMA.PRE.1
MRASIDGHLDAHTGSTYVHAYANVIAIVVGFAAPLRIAHVDMYAHAHNCARIHAYSIQGHMHQDAGRHLHVLANARESYCCYFGSFYLAPYVKEPLLLMHTCCLGH